MPRRTHVVRILAVVACLTFAALAARVDPAYACSCAPLDPRSALAAADGAFVGTFLEQRNKSNGRADYVFRVERSLKGAIGSTVVVESADNGAACGLEVAAGQRIGLLLERSGGAWTSLLCWQIEPEALIAAAQPLPAPTGRGPLTILVGGRAGDVRTFGLDRQGRTLAYGRGRGQTFLLAVCPGARRGVELAYTQPGFLLAVRDLRTFRLVRERTHRPRRQARVAALACLDAAGTPVLFETSDAPAAVARIVVGTRTVWSGKALAAAFSGATAYVSAGARGTALMRIDLRRGTAMRLATLPAFTATLAVAPDRRVAGVVAGTSAGRASPPSRLVVYDPAVRPTVRTIPLAQANVTGDVAWSSGRLVFLPRWNADRVRVYDMRLRSLGTFGRWNAGSSVVAGGRAYGVGQGAVLSAALPRGPARALRTLPTPVTHTVTAVR